MPSLVVQVRVPLGAVVQKSRATLAVYFARSGPLPEAALSESSRRSIVKPCLIVQRLTL
jgi:hypothetical protein